MDIVSCQRERSGAEGKIKRCTWLRSGPADGCPAESHHACRKLEMEQVFVSQAYGPSWGCYSTAMVGMNVAVSTMDTLTSTDQRIS
jgi:hypothetical protein